jgi:MscS family membrane protein
MILEKKADLTPDQSDNQLIVFFRDFFKVLIVIAGIMLVMKYVFDINVASLITGLSIIGAAIALALRESLENLIASFIIFFDKPFTTGDLVKVQQITGTVERIGLRSTRIRSDQKTYVSVPNKQMVDSVLDNLSLRTQRRADLRIEIGVVTEKEKLQVLLEGIKKILSREGIEDFHAYFGEITNTAFIIQADYYTAPITYNEFLALKEVINFSIVELLEENKIEISGASTDIRVQRSAR